ncbi:hypothetical protein [Paenibacillus alkalitolerans]|uniref:hypothetical protein n=1 Tax=Paenibacillus alkalitolerans TaxID=2799335 RepID=UPI0018F3BCE3|nr:hypothetical protein [Paenibacillus alkalitolerans]
MYIRERVTGSTFSRTIRKQDGGVSVYLLLILVALFLFHILLIDIVRYRMVHSESEAAARSAGRSVMSNFHTGLLKYGLFGMSGSESESSSVIRNTLEKSPSVPRGMTLFDTALQQSQFAVDPLYHLGDHHVFRKQVLEKMKYLAGIEFAREITQKVYQGKQQIAQAQQFAEMSKRMEQLLRKRDAELERAWNTAQALVHSALSKADKDEISDGDMRIVQRRLDNLKQQLKDAEQTNDLLIKEMNRPVSNGRRNPAEDEIIPHVSILPSTYFGLYKAKAGSIVSLLGSVKNKLRNDSDPEDVQRARDKLNEFADEWLAAKSKEEEKRRREMSQVQQLQADERNKMDREIKKVGELWKDGCMPSGTASYMNLLQAYKKLEGENGLYSKYKQYNLHQTSGGMSELNSDDAQSFGLQSLTMLNRITELAEAARDEVFVNEFALTFFTHRTWDKMRYPVRVHPNIGDRAGHVLKNQEAEYILYGLPDCTLNLSAAHTEVFALRMALRTVESLAQPKKAALGSPLLVLLAAMAEAAQQANTDTIKLLSGENVDLPFLRGVTMNYKDHLRLFYLLHSDDASVLSRMQALIELNTTADLMKHYSAVRVHVKIQPQLWLLDSIKPIETEAIVSY